MRSARPRRGLAAAAWVQLAYKPRVKRFVPAIRELPAFIGAAHALDALRIPDAQEEMTTLRDGARTLGILRRAARWLVFEPGDGNELVASVYEYINLLFLLDVNAFVFAIEQLRASQRTMQDVFEALGYLDAMQAVSRWRASLPCWTTPQFVPAGKVLAVDTLYHPLLSVAVPNSFQVEDASVLITGSNMSGKTTFVPALGPRWSRSQPSSMRRPMARSACSCSMRSSVASPRRVSSSASPPRATRDFAYS